MMSWNVQLFSVTDALIMLWIPSTKQIREITGNQHWDQRVREIILTGILKNYSQGNSLFIWELWQIAISSSETLYFYRSMIILCLQESVQFK